MIVEKNLEHREEPAQNNRLLVPIEAIQALVD